MYRAAHHLRHVIESGFGSLVAAVECAGFWCSIVLPFLHVPLFAAFGLTRTTVPVLATLWGLNGLALVIGSRHSPSASRGPFDRET